MLQKFFYLLVAFCLLVYFLRALLLAGYSNIQTKNGSAGTLIKSLFINLLTLRPLLQRTLPQRNLEYKIFSRFSRKSEIYYFSLWFLLLVIMFLTAKLYFGFF